MSSTLVRSALLIAGIAGVAFMLAACSDDGGGDNGGSSTPAASFAEACQPTNETGFAAPPPQIIDTSKTYTATIATTKGDIVVELFSDVPITTNNFVFLACKGFYNALTFYRVEKDPAPFVIQGGDPTGTGRGGPGYTIPDEDDGDHLMEVGVISMAKSGPDTTGSVFFITIGNGPAGLGHLEAGFTVFGRVIEGMDVAAEQIALGDVIDSITIEER